MEAEKDSARPPYYLSDKMERNRAKILSPSSISSCPRAEQPRLTLRRRTEASLQIDEILRADTILSLAPRKLEETATANLQSRSTSSLADWLPPSEGWRGGLNQRRSGREGVGAQQLARQLPNREASRKTSSLGESRCPVIRSRRQAVGAQPGHTSQSSRA